MLPSTYRPKTVTDFIGPARKHAQFIDKLVAQAVPGGDPLRLLLLGHPGIGKSELAEHFIRALKVSKWSISKFNGVQLKIDEVETIARGLQLTDMFDSYRVVRIEEVDQVPRVAQVRLLTLLDDLPQKSAVVATSNCKLAELEARFQRRFIVLAIEPPSEQDIFTLITTHWKLGETAARQIATFACGNVGQALLDAEAALAAA